MSYDSEGRSGDPGFGQGPDPYAQSGPWGAPSDAPPPGFPAPGFPAPQYPAPPAPVVHGPQAGYGPAQPGYGPPGYPPPYYGPPMMARKTNGMAVAGMVIGILSLVLFWAWFLGPVLAVLGIIFSSVGISQCNRERQEGKGMAIAGLVCSLISAAFWVVLVIAVASFLHSL